MDPLIAELQHQYHSTLDMYTAVLEACPDQIWHKAYGAGSDASVPFWREAYHAIFWIHSFLGPKDKVFQRHPFGVDIDPWVIIPSNNRCERSEALEYAAQTQAYVDQVFEAMTIDELSGPDDYDETDFRSVHQRLMYGLRHGQHHVGKLTAYLNLEGIELAHWRG